MAERGCGGREGTVGCDDVESRCKQSDCCTGTNRGATMAVSTIVPPLDSAFSIALSDVPSPADDQCGSGAASTINGTTSHSRMTANRKNSCCGPTRSPSSSALSLGLHTQEATPGQTTTPARVQHHDHYHHSHGHYKDEKQESSHHPCEHLPDPTAGARLDDGFGAGSAILVSCCPQTSSNGGHPHLPAIKECVPDPVSGQHRDCGDGDDEQGVGDDGCKGGGRCDAAPAASTCADHSHDEVDEEASDSGCKGGGCCSPLPVDAVGNGNLHGDGHSHDNALSHNGGGGGGCCSGGSDDLVENIRASPYIKEAKRLLALCCQACWGDTAAACCHSACCAVVCCLLKVHAQMHNILNGKPAINDDPAFPLLDKNGSPETSSDDAATTVEVILMVGGMDCSDCSAKVEQQLLKLPGVKQARSSAMTGRTQVIYDSAALQSAYPTASGSMDTVDQPLFDAGALFVTQCESLGYPTQILPSASSTGLRFAVHLDDESQRGKAQIPGAGAGAGNADNCRRFSTEKQLIRALLTLRCTPGVQADTVAYHYDKKQQQHTLACEFDPSLTGARRLVAALDRAGCTVTLLSNHSTESGREGASETLLRSWRRRWWWSALFCLPVIFIAFIVPVIGGSTADAFDRELTTGLPVKTFLLFLLATPIQFWIGYPLYNSSYRSLRYTRGANADTLVILSTSVAYFYSIIATISAMAGAEFTDEEFFETSAVLLTLIVLGHYLEALAKGKTSDVLDKLMQMTVTHATLLVDYQPSLRQQQDIVEQMVDIQLIERNDVVKIMPGERVPTDGVILWGTTSVDQSMVTGESMPVQKQVGDMLYGSTINQTGCIHLQVTRTSSENTLSAITQLVQEAQNSKPRIQRLADQIASYFVPAILVLTVVVFVLWLSLAATGVVSTDRNSVTFALRFAIATLVISCPCAIGLAVPTAVMAGSGLAALHGILFKSGDIIERCEKVNTVVFDKTGTLTMGRPAVSSYRLLSNLDGVAMHDVWSWIGSAESGSEHPLAQSIMSFAAGEIGDIRSKQLGFHSASSTSVGFPSPTEFESVAGKGVRCKVDQRSVIIGTQLWLEENQIDSSAASGLEAKEDQTEPSSASQTRVFVAIDGVLLLMIALSDAVKAESKSVIETLHALNIEVWMCSGDNPSTARAVGAELGLLPERVLGAQLPGDKAALVKRLQTEGRVVAMVGDGINDSPALARADVGIAVSQGTDIAAEAAHVMLMKNDMMDVVMALHIARRTFRCIRWNFTWAFLYNLIAIPFAVGVFYPAGGVAIPPPLAGLSELLSSLPVVLFSLLLRYYRPPVVRPDSGVGLPAGASSLDARTEVNDTRTRELSAASTALRAVSLSA